MLKSCLKIRDSGFTLIELLIGIAIVSMVLAFGLPGFRSWIQNAQLRNSAESILNGLQTARIEATKRNTPMQFIMGTGSTWTVACPASVDCPVAVPTIDQNAAGAGGANGVIVTPVAPLPAPAVVTFDNFGARTNPPAAVGMVLINLTNDTAVLPASESKPLRITIDTSGSIRMCSPQIVAANDPRAC